MTNQGLQMLKNLKVRINKLIELENQMRRVTLINANHCLSSLSNRNELNKELFELTYEFNRTKFFFMKLKRVDMNQLNSNGELVLEVVL